MVETRTRRPIPRISLTKIKALMVARGMVDDKGKPDPTALALEMSFQGMDRPVSKHQAECWINGRYGFHGKAQIVFCRALGCDAEGIYEDTPEADED